MNKEQARAELARRKTLREEGYDLEDSLPSKRPATWKEFSTQMPFYGSKGELPEDAELSPLQSGILGLSGAIDKTGHGIQQNVAGLLGADDWAAKNKAAAMANRASLGRAKEDNPKSALAGEVAGGLASSLPFDAAGAIPSAALWGANQFRTPDESLLTNIAIPTAGAAIIPPALSMAGSGFKRIAGKPKASIAKDIVEIKGAPKAYKKDVRKTAAERTKASRDVGVQLTPGEASGSPVISKQQATAGRTEEGAGKLESFYRGKGGRYEQENKAVDSFFKSLGVNSKSVSPETARKVRSTAQDIIKEQVEKRKTTSAPLYQKGGQSKLASRTIGDLLKDENIAVASRQVAKDPTFKEASKAMDIKSVEYWDLMKRNIDDKISSALSSGNKNKARLLQQSKDKLVKELDAVSADYAKARSVFSNESEVLEELTSSNLGKIANLKDKELKNVSKILFDPSEIDPKTLNTVRDKLFKENPQIYYDALAQNMHSKMDTIARSATKRELPAFYAGILKTDKTYNMYRDALKHNPEALRRLEVMKTAFPDLGGDFTPKTASGLEKTGMTNTRDLLKGLALKLFKGGRYDKAAVEFITDPKWLEQSEKILSKPDGPKKSLALAMLLNKIANQEEQ